MLQPATHEAYTPVLPLFASLTGPTCGHVPTATPRQGPQPRNRPCCSRLRCRSCRLWQAVAIPAMSKAYKQSLGSVLCQLSEEAYCIQETRQPPCATRHNRHPTTSTPFRPAHNVLLTMQACPQCVAHSANIGLSVHYCHVPAKQACAERIT